MASVQCHKTYEENCPQKSQHGSFGQKIAELFKGHHNDHSNAGHATSKTQTTQLSSYTQTQITTTTHPTNKTRREHKRNGLIHKIKDGLSGHSSDSGSSSDSDSDNEGCQNRKN